MAEQDMGGFSSVESAITAMTSGHLNIAYDAPWWGDKVTQGIRNRGFVIGFRNDEMGARWRLDFDPVKQLHINWSQDVPGGEAVKECYRVVSLRPRDTLFDYYVGWTRRHFDSIPADVKERLGSEKRWNGRYWS
jgi:hypothetical protein